MQPRLLKFFSAIVVAITVVASTPFTPTASAGLFHRRPIAMVYYGPGVCPGCPQDLAASLSHAGFRIQKAYPGDFTPDALSNIALLAVPGGDQESDVMHALLPGEADNIRNFVLQGGHYLGVCLGADLANPLLIDTTPPEPGLNLFDGTVQNHSLTQEPRMELISWKTTTRWMYFQDGPEFHLTHPELVDIWAHYTDGTIAAFQAPLGQGKVGLIGPHLESTIKWLRNDSILIPDGSGFIQSNDLLQNFLNTLTN